VFPEFADSTPHTHRAPATWPTSSRAASHQSPPHCIRRTAPTKARQCLRGPAAVGGRTDRHSAAVKHLGAARVSDRSSRGGWLGPTGAPHPRRQAVQRGAHFFCNRQDGRRIMPAVVTRPCLTLAQTVYGGVCAIPATRSGGAKQERHAVVPGRPTTLFRTARASRAAFSIRTRKEPNSRNTFPEKCGHNFVQATSTRTTPSHSNGSGFINRQVNVLTTHRHQPRRSDEWNNVWCGSVVK